MTQRKRTPARIEAEKRYAEEGRRTKKPIGFRVSDEDMAVIDAARGAKSRAEFALDATLKAARRVIK